MSGLSDRSASELANPPWRCKKCPAEKKSTLHKVLEESSTATLSRRNEDKSRRRILSEIEMPKRGRSKLPGTGVNAPNL